MTAASAPAPPAADLFGLLWDTLEDVMGTATVATLVRRAAGRAATSQPDLKALVVRREGLGYQYAVPAAWEQPGDGAALAALKALSDELRPLLVELTGPVIVRRLERMVPLREHGIVETETPA